METGQKRNLMLFQKIKRNIGKLRLDLKKGQRRQQTFVPAQ
jgi:hypothetical protein